ncbi:MAG: ABC-F family ATP-binding cassette domain-containing protein [Myxococcota bacterium]|nr:ABC-F family ATP-binding cassette domain-containing protein [Myxococcota bacterium]MDW8364053.1 ABC-F family ATP-binding cassette domain-containing protein [Myxococcales bacterium]
MLLSAEGLSFGYGGETLFRDVSLRLERGDRVGLVAPNGAGKTTLLRVLLGELEPTSGSVWRAPGLRVGVVRQRQDVKAHGTARQWLEAGFATLRAIRERIEALQRAIEDVSQPDARSVAELAELHERWRSEGGEALNAELGRIADRVGLPQSLLDRPVGALSGGERARLAIGRALAQRPELLLLDEPTNHLDVQTTERLEELLRRLDAALLVVSHDRALLDAVCTRTAELGTQRLRMYPVPYSRYVEMRRERLDREQRRVEEQRAFVARTEEFIRRNINSQRTAQARSRRTMLEKLERLESPEDVWAPATRLALRFAQAPRSGDLVLEGRGLGARRADRWLYRGLDLVVRRGMRIGIIGPNGAGKSTLLAQLAGHGAAGDEGTVRVGSQVHAAFLDQHLESLDDAGSAIDEIRSVRPDLVPDAVRQYLARFRFVGDDPFRAVRSLSGGERTRLALAKMLLVPRNLLLLDEPTNHLDIPSREILEEALAHFVGAVLVASHDRYFLDRVCTHVLAFEPDGVRLHPGNHADWKRRAPASGPVPTPRESHGPMPTSGDSSGRDAHEARKAVARAEERRRRSIERLEAEIARMEARLGALRAELVAMQGDWEAIAARAEQERALTAELERAVERWAALHEGADAS